MEWKNIQLEHEDAVWILMVNRPDVRNAPTVKEFHASLDLLDTVKPGVLTITGAGDRAFVSGAYIGDFCKRTKIEALDAIHTGLFTRIENFVWPVIGAANNFALDRLTKLSLNASSRAPLGIGLTLEMLAQGILFDSKDKYEGMTAFLEKRKPEFKGE